MRDPEAKQYVQTLVLAALLGFPVAFAAVLFQTAIHDLIHLVWEVIPDELGWSEPSWWYVILVPALAGLLVAGAVRLPGHGGHSPLEGLGAEPIPPIVLTSILPAALATLGLGLVLGPEAPLIALGLGLGALAVKLLRSEGTGAQLLVFSGAFAAVAALFGGPLIAAFLLFEVTAVSGKIPAQQIGRALLPGFVAAGTGALVFTGVADWDGLHQTSLALPSLPPYDSVRLTDLAWCLVMAAIVAGVVVAIRHLAHRVAAQSRLGPLVLLIAAGLAVGVLAVVFRAVTDRPVDLVLFSGQTELPAVVAEGSAGVLHSPRRDEGARLRRLSRRRIPRWAGLPRHCARRGHRRGRRQRLPRAAYDARRRGRDRRRDDRGAQGPLHGRSARDAPPRPFRRRRRADRGSRGCDRVGRRQRAPEPRRSSAGATRRGSACIALFGSASSL